MPRKLYACGVEVRWKLRSPKFRFDEGGGPCEEQLRCIEVVGVVVSTGYLTSRQGGQGEVRHRGHYKSGERCRRLPSFGERCLCGKVTCEV